MLQHKYSYKNMLQMILFSTFHSSDPAMESTLSRLPHGSFPLPQSLRSGDNIKANKVQAQGPVSKCELKYLLNWNLGSLHVYQGAIASKPAECEARSTTFFIYARTMHDSVANKTDPHLHAYANGRPAQAYCA